MIAEQSSLTQYERPMDHMIFDFERLRIESRYHFFLTHNVYTISYALKTAFIV